MGKSTITLAAAGEWAAGVWAGRTMFMKRGGRWDQGWVLESTSTVLTMSWDSDPWHRRLRDRLPFLFLRQLPMEIRTLGRRLWNNPNE